MKLPLSPSPPLSGVGETRVVFGHWSPSEGTPARLGGATHVLVSSPAGAARAVGKVSVPQHLSVVTGGEEEAPKKVSVPQHLSVVTGGEEEAPKNKPVRNDGVPETVGGGKGEEEDGLQGKLEDVEEGEKVLVSTTEGDVGSVEIQLDIGETSGELAEAEPSKVSCSEPLVVVCAEASKDRVGPHHQVKTAWEEGAKTPPSDHETATTTSQHADCRPGVVEVLDIEIIDPHVANHTESETKSPGSKIPDSNPPNSNPPDSKPPDPNTLDSNPPNPNTLDSNPPNSNPLDSRPLDSDKVRQEGNGEEKFWTSAGSLMPQVRRL